jgi:2-keto-3-deoxy-L-rhamnonate aldolase RhmA
MHCASPAYALKALSMGFTFVTVGGDTRFVTMGAAAAVQEMRTGVAAKAGTGASSSSPY